MYLTLLLAMIFDGLLGEPKWLYSRLKHPVTWMSALLMAGENKLNNPDKSPSSNKLVGLLWILFCTTLCASLALALQDFIQNRERTGILLAIIASVFLAFRSLIDHVVLVEKALIAEDIVSARLAVSMIVGRDTEALDENGITRASIESLAENFSDGVVAPAFWFLIAGLPGIVAYKMINTADSMIGNRTTRFEAFGWASAKIDDIANYIPARLSVLILLAAASISRAGNLRSAISTAYQYHGLHASPNAGWPEATIAGLLGVKLGGPRLYKNGNSKDSAWLGNGREVEAADLKRALILVKYSWGLILIALIIGLIL